LVAGMLSPATGVGVRVLLPQLVQEDALAQANALTSTSMQFAFLVGPVLAGILVTHVGGAYALMMDAGSFLLMGLLVFSLPSNSRSGPVAAPAEKTNWLSGFALLCAYQGAAFANALIRGVLFLLWSFGSSVAALQ